MSTTDDFSRPSTGTTGTKTKNGIKDDLSQMGNDMQDIGSDVASQARDKANRMMGVAKEKGAETMHQLQDQVRQKPATALGIAAGVGLLLGLMMGRR